MFSVNVERREFLRLAAAAALLAVPARPLRAAPRRLTLRIGVILPHEDPAAAGAGLGRAEAEHGARLFGSVVDVQERPAGTARDAASAAVRLIEEGAHAIVGGGTPAAADAIMDATAQAGVLFMNVGAPLESLRRPCEPLSFHILPSDAMRRDALALATAAPPGSRALAWHPSLTRFGAAQVNDRFSDRYGRPMTERSWSAWMALKILFDGAQRANTTEPHLVARHLTNTRTAFDGHKGLQLTFRPVTHQLRQPLYIVHGDAVLEELPPARVPQGRTHAQHLDGIGSGGDPCAS